MSFKRVEWTRRYLVAVGGVLLGLCLAAPAWAQSLTTGGLNGTVTDQNGAAIPGAKVTATNNSTGASHSTVSQANGGYTIPLLEPDNYTITVSATGFEAFKQGPVAVGVSAQVGLPVKLSVGSSSQTVEVTGEAPLISPENANTTAVVTAAQIENIPDPGGDITFYSVFTAGAYINKSSTGGATFLGGGAMGYTFDGADYNDPANNLNDSGATNLLLGSNDIAEVSTNTNSYSVDQGRYSAAQINYTSKSGGNNIHGNLMYQWNGRVLNAYDYFTKATPGNTAPKPLDNVNNYAGSIGGPIIKNKLFEFFDNEGTFIELPTPESVTFPTPALETYMNQELGIGGYETSTSYTQNNGQTAQNNATNPYKCLPATAPNKTTTVQPCGTQPAGVNETAFMNYYLNNPNLFGVGQNRWQGGGSYVLTPDALAGCPLLGGVDPTGVNTEAGSFTTPTPDPSYNPQVQNTGTKPGNQVPTDTGCAWSGTDYGSNTTFEDLFKNRIDWTKSQTDTVWVSFGRDGGEQATGFSPVDPAVLSSDSWQPEWEGGADWTHIFSPTVTNDLSANMLTYWAIFGLKNPTADQALMPYDMTYGSPFTSLAGSVNNGDGRNITQYGYVDNLTWVKGQHTLKFGANFRRDDSSWVITDPNDSDTVGSNTDMSPYLFGYASANSQTFPLSNEQPGRSFALDMFAGDTWQVRRNLTFIFGVRATHNSNVKDLQGLLGIVAPWEDQSHTLSAPVNTVVQNGQNLWQSVPMAVWQPRFAITWQPSNNTLVKAGWGLFSQVPTTSGVENLMRNSPNYNSWTAGYGSNNQGSNGGTNGCPFNPLAITTSVCGILADPGQTLSAYNATQATNNIFLNNFAGGAPSCVYYQASGQAEPTVNGSPVCTPQNSFTVNEPNLEPSYSEQYSLGVQHQFGRNFSLNTQYAGLRNVNNSQSYDPLAFQSVCNGCYAPYSYIAATSTNDGGIYSDADPRWSGWTQSYYSHTGQWSTANALEVTAQQRMEHGLTFDVNYTWAHNMQSINNPCYQCAIPAPGHTYSGSDIRSDVNLDYTWTMPFHASGDWWGRLVNDWQLSGATFLESGQAIAPSSAGLPGTPQLQLGSASNAVNPAIEMPNTPVYAKEVNFIPCPASNKSCGSVSTKAASVQWFYPMAFATNYDSTNKACYNPLTNQDVAFNPTCAQYGYQFGAANQPGVEAELRGPGFMWSNLDITKMVTLRESMKLRIDVNMYNLFNHNNLGSATMPAVIFNAGTASTAGLGSSIYQAGAIRSGSSPATGLLGSSLGGDSNPRMIAFTGKITF